MDIKVRVIQATEIGDKPRLPGERLTLPADEAYKLADDKKVEILKVSAREAAQAEAEAKRNEEDRKAAAEAEAKAKAAASKPTAEEVELPAQAPADRPAEKATKKGA